MNFDNHVQDAIILIKLYMVSLHVKLKYWFFFNIIYISNKNVTIWIYIRLYEVFKEILETTLSSAKISFYSNNEITEEDITATFLKKWLDKLRPIYNYHNVYHKLLSIIIILVITARRKSWLSKLSKRERSDSALVCYTRDLRQNRKIFVYS